MVYTPSMNHSQMTLQSSNAAATTMNKAGGNKKPKTLYISISYGNSSEIEINKPRHSQFKKNPMPACTFFLQGRCNRGSSCRFSHQVQVTNHKPPVQNTQVQPAKSGFPALCKQGPSANTKAGTEYKNMASVPVSETTPKQPWVKTKGMVVIYRQVKNGKFATTT